jgi:hypothetical protein
VLEDKDILQVDATIITGILLMLSITGFIGSGIGKPSFSGLASLVSIVLIPFSVSAVLVVQLERMKPSHRHRVKSISLTLMEFGFVALIFLFILYFLFPQIQIELHLK